MADQELTRILADLARQRAVTRQPNMQQVTGLSQAILSGVGLQKPWSAQKQNNAKDVRGPSFVNRVLDIMSRPLYGTLNALKGEINRSEDLSFPQKALSGARMLSPITNPDMLGDIWAGLSGKEKTTGKDIISEGESMTGSKMPGVAKAITGFGIDVLADPTTYMGFGLAGKIGGAAKKSTEALGAIEQSAGKSSQTLAEEISQRATQQAHKLNTTVPQKNMVAPAPGAPPRVFAAGPGPNLPEELNKIPPTQTVPNPSPTDFSFDAATLGKKEVPRQPIAAIGPGPSSSVANPLDILSENLSKSTAGRSELSKLADSLPERADPMLALKVLNERIAATKSPIVKNLLKREVEKIQAGVKPADILSEARTAPAPFPELSINPRWIDEAKNAAARFLRNKRNVREINHIGQTNLYNSILNAASKVRKDRRAFHVFQMLRVAEEEILASGKKLVDAEGISVRLSDIANMTGGARNLNAKLVDDFRKARPSQQVEDLKAYTTPQVASEVLDPVIKTGADIAQEAKILPPSQTVMMGSKISRELMKIAEAAGASSREAKTAKAFIDDLFNPVRDNMHSVIHKEARNLVRQTTEGIVDAKTMQSISTAAYKSLGANPKILGREIQQNKVVEGIMTKFATWWGAKDLKPFSREYIDTARNVAAAFAETITPLVRATKPSQRAAAFAVSQGKREAVDPAEKALADQFSYMIERLMGTHGITDNAEAVVFRSGTVMKELNDELPEAMKFINKFSTDKLGRKTDYSNGKWMHSWKEWESKEPAETLYQLTRALQMVTRKNSMWDDAAVRWAMPIKGGEFQHTVDSIPRLKGNYFPKQIADQLNNLQKQLDRDVFKSPHKAIEMFDKVQRMWKTGVTIYSPSHHIRNLNGDIYLAALDGVVSPKPYAIATKVLHAFPTRYKDIESVFNIMDPKLRDIALRARPGNTVLKTRRGETMTSEQVYQAAESQGLFIRAVDIEDLAAKDSPTFGGRVHGAASRVSELRDHWVRLAHFVDVLSKSNQPLRIAVEQAGRRVKKFHPDGMDMTGFEQNVMRRVIPFYSWIRKATPLVIEGAIMRPHITMAFPKAMANMQSITGIESEGPGDPFPMDQMFPDWIKEKGIGPVLQPGSGIGRDENWRGENPGYTIINPTNPFIDQTAALGAPGKTLLSGLTPAARIPMELLTGNTSLGIPLENVEGGTPGYLAQQIPPVGIGARITGLTRDNEPYNPEQLTNWLTSAGITGTGPYQGQAQTEIRDVLAQLAKERRGDYR
jgi:hypothetical protein